MKQLYLIIAFVLAATFSLCASPQKPANPLPSSSFNENIYKQQPLFADMPSGGTVRGNGGDGWLDMDDDDPLKFAPVNDNLWIIVSFLMIYSITIGNRRKNKANGLL